MTYLGPVYSYLWGWFSHFEHQVCLLKSVHFGSIWFLYLSRYLIYLLRNGPPKRLSLGISSGQAWPGREHRAGRRWFNFNRSCVVIAVTVVVYSLRFICRNGGGITFLSEQLQIFLFQWKLFPHKNTFQSKAYQRSTKHLNG